MNTEDLFKCGVTPKEGEFAGEKLEVVAIEKGGVKVKTGNSLTFFRNGDYEIYKEPKTLFEDESIKPTWGNLKKAMETAGLPDDTLFFTYSSKLYLCGYGIEPAAFSIESLSHSDEKRKKYILVE